MEVSIITVCFNAEQGIRTTIESVLSQEYSDYEYIIKDGGSTDATLTILKEYESAFEKKGISYEIISEKDHSLYEAMNIGILHSHGKWLNFMNAGDEFADDKVLSGVFQNFHVEDVDILYGDNLIEDRFGIGLNRANLNRIEKSMPFNHQAAFFDRDRIIHFMYKEEFLIGADYDLIIRMYKEGCKFQYINCAVSKYRLDGISSSEYVKTAKERQRVRNIHGYKDVFFIEKGKIFAAFLKEWLERGCPPGLLKYLNRFYKKYIKKYEKIL